MTDRHVASDETTLAKFQDWQRASLATGNVTNGICRRLVALGLLEERGITTHGPTVPEFRLTPRGWQAIEKASV